MDPICLASALGISDRSYTPRKDSRGPTPKVHLKFLTVGIPTINPTYRRSVIDQERPAVLDSLASLGSRVDRDVW